MLADALFHVLLVGNLVKFACGRLRVMHPPPRDMRHKPSATAEGCRTRSIDPLRPYMEQIEAHILKLAGVKFVPETTPENLALVS